MHLHTHFPRGAHVFVIMRNGEKFEDKYWPGAKDGRIRFVGRGIVPLSKIRSISYRRLRTS